MTQDELKAVANISLGALNDNRVMLPSSATDAISSLKNILRQMANGQVILSPAPPPTAVKAFEDEAE
jgi:hypothetical protein